MESNFEEKKFFTDKFITAYKRSLKEDYRLFYDDFSEYGNPNSENFIYFIPGINGASGQVRFIFPYLFRRLKRDFFMKCFYLDEFSVYNFIWNKYSLENIIKRKDKIVSDLNNISSHYKKIIILVSSNGFYDFIHAYPNLSQELKDRAELCWVAASPDSFERTPWETFFSKVNGFKKNGEQWFAFPNHNWLKFFNPEAKMNHKWLSGARGRVFSKHDLEFRFPYAGVNWAYASIDCFNRLLKYMLRDFQEPIQIPTNFLIASADGYWQGKTKKDINKVLDKYCANKKEIVYKKTSHLWIVMPDNFERFY